MTEAIEGATRPPGRKARGSAIESLRNRNFRLYLIGQAISQTGNWFQLTAEIWLILLLTDSGAAIGIHSVLRFGPLLLFGVPAGVITDRFDHLKLLFWTQFVTALSAVGIAVASLAQSPSLLVIYATVLVRGVVFAVDNPLRRGFVRDLVSDQELTNAVSLNSSANTIARFVGPALSGVVIATLGVEWCFTINVLSFVPVFVTLLMLDRSKLRPAQLATKARGQVKAGLAYAWRSRRIRRTLLLVTILGLYPLNWIVILPMYAADTFDGDSKLFGFFTSVTAVGAFVGAAVVARLREISGGHFRVVGALMASAFVLVAVTPLLALAVIGLLLLGAAGTSFQIVANSRLQLEAEEVMSGRILAIYSVALVGTRPIGGLAAGLVVEYSGPRAAFLVSAVIVVVATITLAFGTASRAKWSPRNLTRRVRPS